jgi:hypothetical protein
MGNRRQQPQGSVSGIVESTVQSVWQVLLNHGFGIPESERQALDQHTGPMPFIFTVGKPGAGMIRFEVDKNNHQIAVQGEWWYRGVTSVTPTDKGAVITYQIYNIAPGLGWWVAQYAQCRASVNRMKGSFIGNLAAIGKSLDCKAYLNSA